MPVVTSDEGPALGFHALKVGMVLVLVKPFHHVKVPVHGGRLQGESGAPLRPVRMQEFRHLQMAMPASESEGILVAPLLAVLVKPLNDF
mmetsp:Transcript_31207/g.40185  ORF Transcript_31207/g.40185 Transcript_31207/m.40185 type:complete len:89 (+) Transcript_31207:440-706(+)